MKKVRYVAPLLSLAVLFPTATNVFAEPTKNIPVETVEFIGMACSRHGRRTFKNVQRSIS